MHCVGLICAPPSDGIGPVLNICLRNFNVNHFKKKMVSKRRWNLGYLNVSLLFLFLFWKIMFPDQITKMSLCTTVKKDTSN